MKAEIKPTEKIDELAENIRPRVEELEKTGDKLEVEGSDLEFLGNVPGIEEYSVNGEERNGLGGSPVDEKAYIKLNSKRDVAEAFLATASGFDLLVVENNREWDLKLLKKFNPSIKEVSEPSEVFSVEKSVNLDRFEDIGIELDDEDVDAVYQRVVG